MRTTQWQKFGMRPNTSGRVRVQGAMLLLAWADFMGTIPWDLLVTLTFDPKRVFPVSSARAEKETLAWCGLVGWTFRRPVAWLIALERHQSGQWHAHVLLAGLPNDIAPLAQLWTLRNGEINVQVVSNSVGAVLYSTKEAALSGAIILSDTVVRYRGQLADTPRVHWRGRMTARGWTRERRVRQAMAIQRWRPWEKSTGPRTPEGKARVSRNAFRGGDRSSINELARMLNSVLRDQRAFINGIRSHLK
jgi:hypothetical protein